MKKKFLGRLLTMLLVAAMVFTLLPASAIAAAEWWGGDDGVAVQSSNSQPFANPTDNSLHYRIPAIVTLSDGTLVAAADQRNFAYNQGADDCSDIDTKVVIATDKIGDYWELDTENDTGYTGNDTCKSGTYIDPILATDGDMVYMLVDLFPGQNTRANCTGKAQSGTGVDSNGNLLLTKFGKNDYSYYLSDGSIYQNGATTAMEGYSVDANFNLYVNNEKQGNLFNYGETDFAPLMTSYLVFRTRSSNGEWSAPQIINGKVKNITEKNFLTAPGKGVVLSDGTIVFPCYQYGNGSNTYLIFGTLDENGSFTWSRSTGCIDSASEGELIDLGNGTLRYFMRSTNDNNLSGIKYVDFDYSGNITTKTTSVTTTPTGYIGADLGALVYSKTSDKQKVVMVSCGTGGSRKDGYIFTFKLDSSNNMTLVKAYQVNSGSYSYSCMTELSDGSIGLLYENGDAGGITYKTINIDDVTGGLTFDSANSGEDTLTKIEDTATNVAVTVPSGSDLSVEPVATVTALAGTKYNAYEITITTSDGKTYTEGTQVTIPVGDDLNGSKLYGFAVNSQTGEIDKATDGQLTDNGTTYTFTAPHFSVVGVAEQEGITDYEGGTIYLQVGEDRTITDETGNYENNYTGPDTTYAKADVTGTTTGGTPAQPEKFEKVSSSTATLSGTYVIGNGSQWLQLSSNGSGVNTIDDPAQATKWEISNSGTSYVIKSGNSYLGHNSGNSNLAIVTASSNYKTWSYDGSKFYYTSSNKNYCIYYSSSSWGVTRVKNSTSTTNCGAAYKYTPAQEKVDGKASTTIVITGVFPGTTSMVVGSTKYTIEVSKATKSVTVQTGKEISFDDASTKVVSNSNSAAADVKLENGKLTITGVTATTEPVTIVTETTIYTVTVSEKPDYADITNTPFIGGEGNAVNKKITGLVIMVGTSYDLDLTGSSSGTWTAGNDNITVDQNGKVTGVKAGESTVTVTIDGVDYTIPVTVLAVPDSPSSAGTSDANYTRTFDIYSAQEDNCTAYYSYNSGAFARFPLGTLFYIKHDCARRDLALFVAVPKDGYALTHATASTGSAFQVIADENDRTKFGTEYDCTSHNISQKDGGHTYLHDQLIANVAKNSGSYAATEDDVHTICNNALTLLADGSTGEKRGADGAMFWSRGTYTDSTQNTGSVSGNTYFIAQPLPRISKTVTAAETNIDLGGYIDYTVEVTIPKTNLKPNLSAGQTTTISYSNNNAVMVIKDPRLQNASGTPSVTSGTVSKSEGTWTISNVVSSTTTDLTYTLKYSVQLTLDNYSDLVEVDDDGRSVIKNTADMSYSYKADFSKGTGKGSASALAKVNVKTKTYVVDFGLPVDIDLTDIGADGLTFTKGVSAHSVADIVTNGKTFTYTPTSVLNGIDTVSLTWENGAKAGSYNVTIIPASNVLYEEGFLAESTTAFADNDRASWSLDDTKQVTSQQTHKTSDTTQRFGFDTNYTDCKGRNGAWVVSGMSTDTNASKALTTTFYGNAIDIIGSCAPDSGKLMAIVKKVDENKAAVAVVDTRYKDEIEQVPLAHLVLGDEDAAYTVTLLAYYQDAATISTAATQSLMSRSNSVDRQMAADLAALGLSMSDVQYYSAADAVATMSLTSTQADTISRAAGTHVEIDGFRVYRSTTSADYIGSEKDITYKNILDVVNGTFVAYTETNDAFTATVETYENAGGPQNEIYLAKDQSVMFKVDCDSVQVSLRAVSGATSWANSETGDVTNISSNTEMYYTVNANEGVITIMNRGDGLLAIGNVKLPDGTTVTTTSELSEDVVVVNLRAALQAAPSEPDQPAQPDTFTPDTFKVNGIATNFFRHKIVTLRVTVSKDVDYVTINGVEYQPNKLMARIFGYSTITITKSVSRGDDGTYTVIAYNNAGTASASQTWSY